MPSYRFTGAYPRVLVGLTEGVNAHHDGTPAGATVEPEPGDEVTTAVPYAHAELELLDEAATPAEAPAEAPAPAEQPAPAPEVHLAPGEIVLTSDEVAHLGADVIAQLNAVQHEDPNPSAPAPETQE